MTESKRQLFAKALSELLTKTYGSVDEVSGDSRLSTYYCYFRAQGRGFCAVNDYEISAIKAGILTFGLLFHSLHCKSTDTLTIFLPATIDPSVRSRFQRLSSCLRVKVELFQLSYYLVKMERLTIPAIQDIIAQPGNDIVARHDTNAFHKSLDPAHSGHAVDIISEVKRLSPLVRAYYFNRAVSFRIKGLEFARLLTPQDRTKWKLQVGVENKKSCPVDIPLPDNTSSAVRGFAHKLTTRRVARRGNKTEYYKRQPESWLESIILENPSLIDPDLAVVHTQVATDRSATLGNDVRRYIDALGLMRDGRLVVIELKITPNIHAVLQVLDYWIWTEQNKAMLQTSNYFPNLNIDTSKPTRLIIAAPEGAFHTHTLVIAGTLLDSIRVELVPLPKRWREL